MVVVKKTAIEGKRVDDGKQVVGDKP